MFIYSLRSAPIDPPAVRLPGVAECYGRPEILAKIEIFRTTGCAPFSGLKLSGHPGIAPLNPAPIG